MTKYLSFFAVFSVLISASSCMKSYNIEGSSDISSLDSRMMYLSTLGDNQLKELDSTEVVHGKFGFAGTTDSVRMAFITFGNTGRLPLVLESGDITVRVNNQKTEWGGTPHNDKLYQFMTTLSSLSMQLNELDHEQTRAFLDGEDMEEVNARLSQQALRIHSSIDSLVTTSISENFDNVLGPGFFMLYTFGSYPEMSPWVMELMSKASDSFKNDPYVKWYINEAQYLQNVNNGLETPPTNAAQASAAPPPATVPPPSAPTPADLAAPAAPDTMAAAAP
ncbi:MAG: DUF4369 domain-containing protein [Prevotella sp.]|nr:DUF4369 domain-containing protein [Prevotella sp.]